MIRKVTLGGREFEIAPLTLDQLQRVNDDLQNTTPLNSKGIDAIMNVLAVALKEQLGSDPKAELKALPGNLDELWNMQKAIAEVTGLRPLMERLFPPKPKNGSSLSAGETSMPTSGSKPDGMSELSAV